MAEQRQNNVALTDEEKEQRAKKRNRTIVTVVSVVAAVIIVVIVLLLLLVKCEPEENVDPPVGHTHTYSSWVVVDEPTCTEEGLRERTCSCGEKETETIAALGHTAGEAVRENETAPTCTEKGSYEEVVSCTVCEEEVSRKTVEVAALGHTAGEAGKENEVAATCLDAGSYEEVIYCTVCGEEMSRKTVTVDALGHDYKGVVTDEALCLVLGEMTYTCTRCNDSYKEEIAPLRHSWGETKPGQAPTCTAAGYTSYETCTRCGYSNRETIPAAGHQGGTATCKAQAVCEVCHEPYGELGDHTPDKTDYIADEKEHWSLCTLCNAEVTVEHVFEGEQNCAICGVTDSKYFTFTLPYGGTTYEIEKNASSVLSGAVKLPNYYNETLITEIGYGAFGHEALTSIEIPEGFTSIGMYAFSGCTSLKSITIPGSVESIKMAAFEGCTSLENVTIPNGVTQIRESAFRDCTALKSINIPESVAMIEIWVFRGCTSLNSVIFADTSSTWSIRKDFNEPLAITPSGDAQKDAEMLATTYWEYTWRKQTD